MTVVLSDDFFMTKTVIPNKFFEILMSRNGTENVLNALTIISTLSRSKVQIHI